MTSTQRLESRISELSGLIKDKVDYSFTRTPKKYFLIIEVSYPESHYVQMSPKMHIKDLIIWIDGYITALNHRPPLKEIC